MALAIAGENARLAEAGAAAGAFELNGTLLSQTSHEEIATITVVIEAHASAVRLPADRIARAHGLTVCLRLAGGSCAVCFARRSSPQKEVGS